MAVYTAIDDSEAYFQVQLYTGNGSANHAITLGGDTAMQPDLVIIKNRDATDEWQIFDAVRGATKVLTMENAAEATDTDTLDSFTSDGFQVDADDDVNTNAEKYVAYCWKINGAGSANEVGTINTSATSVNTTAGISLGSFTGNATNNTVGHGLGVVPTSVWVKGISIANGWGIWSTGISAITDGVSFTDVNSEAYGSPTWFNSTLATSTVTSVGTNDRINPDAKTTLMICHNDVQGFSKFSSYEGNGNADGPFIYLGFRPALIIIKDIDNETDWISFDDQRAGYNADNNALTPNTNAAELTTDLIDMLSNGFKPRSTASTVNSSGATYIYMAWAKSPLVNSEGVPVTAR